MMDTFKISSERYPNILISLTEAVNNAICHGNKLDDAKYVHIDIQKESHALTCCVTDQGSGFDHKKLPDPTADENIENCGGRGVLIIETLCDSFRFLDNGTKLEIVFNL